MLAVYLALWWIWAFGVVELPWWFLRQEFEFVSGVRSTQPVVVWVVGCCGMCSPGLVGV